MAEHEDSRDREQSRQRIALQARVCYMNVDRTLATWTRTSLALIVLGIGLDRYGLLLTGNHLMHVGTRLAPNPLSSLSGIILVVLGTLIALATAVRHQRYRSEWDRTYGYDANFGQWLAFAFTIMAVVFGMLVTAVLLVLGQ
jgi:uncharacterized membrane protein YidH (DUF202 family)